MCKTVRFLLSIGVLSQLFFACKKDDEKVIPTETIPGAQPGYFVVSSIDQSSANGRRAADTYDSEFDLGRILSSDKFLFMIANGGDEPIFNVTLTTDNTPFEISPKNIKVVPGSKASAIVPLLTVGVTHGVLLKGLGSAPTLAKGTNKATIKLTGKTLSGKDTIDVSGEFIVKVDAMVVDAKVLSAGIDAIKDSTNRFVVEGSKTVQLVNSGSVPIRATISYTRYQLTTSGPMTGGIIGAVQYKNEVELLADEIKDISNMVSPLQGYVEDGVDSSDYYYYGDSNIDIKPIKEEGVVANLYELRLISK